MTEKAKSETPWGGWEVLTHTPYCKVKHVWVNPGHRLSYQYHHFREERWMIVLGKALVILDGHSFEYQKGDVVTIPLKAKHRIGNVGTDILVFIEIQQGSYFGEDDIVRLEDDYHRLEK